MKTGTKSKPRTFFTDEFKRHAVAKLRLREKNATDLALELGIRRNQLVVYVFWVNGMTYFSDLSNYEYMEEYIRPNTVNVGWLAFGHEFEKKISEDSDLDLVWDMCRISVAKTRGLHRCEFCEDDESLVFSRKGRNLLLGSAEIRLFGLDGTIYAAPDLIFHYMATHHYVPPPQFIYALRNGFKPLTMQHLLQLKELDLDYDIAPEADPNVKSFRLSDLPE